MTTLLQSLNYQPTELKFGTSGLRGLVADMTDLECYINAVGFLEFLAKAQGLKSGDNVYLAGDLRQSTPRIMHAMHQAITDSGYTTVNCGFIPTPAVACIAVKNNAPCIMVTGSHIPADRNGIKFYKKDGEVLKVDEGAIKQSVYTAREELYQQKAAKFDQTGMLQQAAELPEVDNKATELYMQRYISVFADSLIGKKVVFYQHSAVGRDLLVKMLQNLGAEVVTVGRSDEFIPIDSENVTPEDHEYFKQLASENPDAYAIVSTDGDSDRPFVIDEKGAFHRGDELGAIVANWLKADFAALPVSSSDAVDEFLTQKGVKYEHTKIGSPYVILAMQKAAQKGEQRIVGWEVNGGFLLGCELDIEGKKLASLATRDAIFPIIVALLAGKSSSASAAFGNLPKRFASSGLINEFATKVSQKIVAKFNGDTPEVHKELERYFGPDKSFGSVQKIDVLDGIRIFFDNGDIAHLRPSNNAPQLRIYSVANTQERADEIVAMAINEPNGIFRQIEKSL
ncbi:MAG: phosphomannomutase [Candidatus Woesebacteria bacterium]|jgi:phosphomannomutase